MLCLKKCIGIWDNVICFKIIEILYIFFFIFTDEEDIGGQWMDKILQLYQCTRLYHGLMMVGPSGSGKSTAWRVLLKALELHEGVEGVAHVIGKNEAQKI